MQVAVHGIDTTGISEFPAAEYASGPFVSLRLYDGKGSEIVIFLTTTEDSYKLVAAATEAMEALEIMVAATI